MNLPIPSDRQFSREAVEAVSAAVKASEDAGVKRKFSELFRRLDGVATIDGRGAIQ